MGPYIARQNHKVVQTENAYSLDSDRTLSSRDHISWTAYDTVVGSKVQSVNGGNEDRTKFNQQHPGTSAIFIYLEQQSTRALLVYGRLQPSSCRLVAVVQKKYCNGERAVCNCLYIPLLFSLML
uniref:Uncharacterized protein n=1 Tax=Steinernema glaseri TaxID=37863 RepID=A0A1I8AC98_9BILA